MLARQIKLGSCYVANVSGAKQVVRVESHRPPNGRIRGCYVLTNLRTGRTVYATTAGRFFRAATEAEVIAAYPGWIER